MLRASSRVSCLAALGPWGWPILWQSAASALKGDSCGTPSTSGRGVSCDEPVDGGLLPPNRRAGHSPASHLTHDALGGGWGQQTRSATTAASASAAVAVPGASGGTKERVQVIYLQDVPPRVRAGMVRAVAPGVMRHQLFPRGLADYATPQNLVKHAVQVEAAKLDTKAEDDSVEGQQRQMVAMLSTIARTNLFVRRRHARDEPERMVGVVTAEDVREALARQTRIDLHPSQVLMDTPIATFGDFHVPLNLRTLQDEQLELHLTVNAEKGRMWRGSRILPPAEGVAPARGGGKGTKKGAATAARQPAPKASTAV